MNRIITLGDSLTAGYGVRPGKGWAYQLAELYPDKIFDHRGIPGDDTAGMLERWRRYAHERCPDQLLFLGGSNDLLSGKSPREVLENIQMIHQICVEQNVRLILLQCPDICPDPGPYAWFDPGDAPWLLQRFQHLREIVGRYARTNALICLDLSKILTDTGREDLWLADGVHLNEFAHGKIAQFIFQRKIL